MRTNLAPWPSSWILLDGRSAYDSASGFLAKLGGAALLRFVRARSTHTSLSICGGMMMAFATAFSGGMGATGRRIGLALIALAKH